MRVIAGKYRSRRLQSLPGLDIRPTTDRLRETLFDILTAGNSEALVGTVWLDLFAGTGAVGIEALSRGAKAVYFVESAKLAADLIATNLQSLKAEGAEIIKEDVLSGIRKLGSKGIEPDFVFLDPPYRLEKAYEQVLTELGNSRLVKRGGTVIAEHQKKFDPGESWSSVERFRLLKQGDAALSFYRVREKSD